MAAILSTNFAQSVTDWATVWPLASVTGVQIGQICAAESELAQVRQIGPGTMVTVQRGVEGTASAAHATNTSVAVYGAGVVRTGPVVAPAAVPLRQVTRVLTHAQIQALPSTPQILVPAPGVNRVAFVISMVVRLTITVGYTNVANAAWYLVYQGGGAAASTLTTMSGALAAAGDSLRFEAGAPQSTSAVTGATGQLAGGIAFAADFSDGGAGNSAIRLRDDYASGGNYTAGATANSATISVLYAVLDVSTGVFL